MRVLVTRAIEDAERTALKLRAGGHQPLVAPLRQRVLLEPVWLEGPFAAVIATSRHAVSPPLPRELLQLPCFCVGENTARAARAAGFEHAQALGSDVAGLIARLPQALPPPMRLLYLAGKPRSAALEGEAPTRGYQVTTVERYAMARVATLPEAVRRALAGGEIDTVLHYSAQSARAFVDLAGQAGLTTQAGNALHLCLSSTVAAALPDLWHHKIAHLPEEDALLALLKTS